ncbi:hypothetical protein [Alloacidobacterium dinghuense]|nr:hypothetical protein [Alloacidobacterium dinghuense]
MSQSPAVKLAIEDFDREFLGIAACRESAVIAEILRYDYGSAQK